MAYRIVMQFANDEPLEIIHDGSLKDGMKIAYEQCSKRKQNPLSLTFSKNNVIPTLESDGWKTVSPIERIN